MKRDFLTLSDFTVEEHAALFRRARELKEARSRGEVVKTLAGRTLLLLFEKHSTRTRLSFEAAIGQLGGTAITLPMQESQISRNRYNVEVTLRLKFIYLNDARPADLRTPIENTIFHEFVVQRTVKLPSCWGLANATLFTPGLASAFTPSW